MVDKSLHLFKKAEEPKKHTSLFKHAKSQPEAGAGVSGELESTINRLRVLEERYTNLQIELKVTEENMIHRNKKITTDIKTLTLDINELRKEIDEIKNKVLMIIKEIRDYARKEEIKILQKYIEMWEPMNFVTHQEVEEIINEKISLLHKKL